MIPTHDDKKIIPSFLRGYRVLEQIVASKDPISAADLARQLDMPKATVHRLATQLEAEGLLRREQHSKKFITSTRLYQFAKNVLASSSTHQAFRAVLQGLAEEVGETCNCSLLDGRHIVYFDRIETNWPIRIQLPVGSQLPLHCTASGKLFLAYMPTRMRKTFIQSLHLHKYTDYTITDSNKLEECLATTRDTSVGEDNQEFLQGMVALSVPVMDRYNRFHFAIAIHAPTIRKNIDDLYQYMPSLRQAADTLSLIDEENATP